jgi:hypothetical protein
VSQEDSREDQRFDPPDVAFESKGAAVDPLLRWLRRWTKSRGYSNPGIVVDEDFGTVGLRWLQIFQAEVGLNVTNAFDAQSRAAALILGFDFVAEANEAGMDITRFVQPNGVPTLYWTPGFKPDEDREIIVLHLAAPFSV